MFTSLKSLGYVVKKEQTEDGMLLDEHILLESDSSEHQARFKALQAKITNRLATPLKNNSRPASASPNKAVRAAQSRPQSAGTSRARLTMLRLHCRPSCVSAATMPHQVPKRSDRLLV